MGLETDNDLWRGENEIKLPVWCNDVDGVETDGDGDLKRISIEFKSLKTTLNFFQAYSMKCKNPKQFFVKKSSGLSLLAYSQSQLSLSRIKLIMLYAQLLLKLRFK